MAKGVIAAGAVVSALAAGYGAVSADQAQQKSRKMQANAQQQAQAAAQKQNAQADEALMRANKKQPDVAALLADATAMKPQQTKLGGSNGIASSNLLGM